MSPGLIRSSAQRAGKASVAIKASIQRRIGTLDDAQTARLDRFSDELTSTSDAPTLSWGEQPVDGDHLSQIASPVLTDDPVWNIIGMADESGDDPEDIAAEHDRHLADAYGDHHSAKA